MAFEGLQLGQYRLQRLLGSGGMGEVYLAEDARIHQQVAIKVSRTETSFYPQRDDIQNAIRLFQREASVIARLDHPHILPLFSYGEENVSNMTLTYLVMPYRPEGSFADWLQARISPNPLPIKDVAYFIGQAADALQYAHDHQVIHQDVKPSNFLVRAHQEQPDYPDLLLADFGIAKLNSATSSISHSIRGTPTYMAPEQWSGEAVTATDQYALAVLAYELLAGRSPFTGRQEQIMYQHFSVQPQPPSAFNSLLSQNIDAIILTALAKQPADRFPSILTFAHALQQTFQGTNAPPDVPTPSTLRSATNPGPMVIPSTSPAGNYASTIAQSSPPSDVSRTIVATGAQHHSSNSSLIVILSIGLVLLVIGASVSFFYLQSNTHTTPPVNNVNAVATTHANDATTFAATAQTSNHQAPATTPTSPPVPTVSSNTFPPPHANLVLNDPLSNNNNGYNWETKPDADGVCQFTGNMYSVYESKVSTTEYCPAYNTSFGSPFAYEVQMAIAQGDLGGLLVRDNTHNISYYFRFRQNGDYDFVFYDSTSSQAHGPLVASNASAFHPGYNQLNHIAVIVHSSSIDLYVNAQYVNSVNIGSYGSGYIGVFTTDKGNPTEAIFSDAKVWSF